VWFVSVFLFSEWYVSLCTMQSYSETIQKLSFHELVQINHMIVTLHRPFFFLKSLSLWGSVLLLLIFNSYIFSKLYIYLYDRVNVNPLTILGICIRFGAVGNFSLNIWSISDYILWPLTIIILYIYIYITVLHMSLRVQNMLYSNKPKIHCLDV